MQRCAHLVQTFHQQYGWLHQLYLATASMQGAPTTRRLRIRRRRWYERRLADVFVLPEYRARRLGVWLIEVIMIHPDLQGLRRWSLATRDAHGLYGKFGFTPLRDPSLFMELYQPDIYSSAL